MFFRVLLACVAFVGILAISACVPNNEQAQTGTPTVHQAVYGADNTATAEVDVTSEHFPLRFSSDAWEGPARRSFDRPQKTQWFLKDPEDVADLIVTMEADLGNGGKDIDSWMRLENIPAVLDWYDEGLGHKVVTESAGEINPEGRSVRFKTITYRLKIGNQDRQVMFFYAPLPGGDWFWLAATNRGEFRPFATTDKVNEIVNAVSVGRQDIARMNN